MTGIVGSLKVLLGLDAAEFTQGLTKAEAQSAKFAASQKRNQLAIDKQVKALQAQTAVLGKSTREAKLFELAQKGATDAQLKSADAALRQAEAHEAGVKIGRLVAGTALAAGAAIVYMTKSAIDNADHLNDLSKKTGIAATTLGGIGFAAAQAGGDLDSAAAAIGKLNKSIAEAAAGNKEASEFFDVLGISVKNAAGQTKNADAVLLEVANRFAEFEDGPEKAALALRGFGKAGADIIPLLNDGGSALRENIEYYKRFSGVTDELAQKADAFNDTLEKVKLLSSSFGATLAAELLPLLQAIADEILHAKENSDLFSTGAAAVRTVLETIVVVGANVAFVFKGVGREIGAILAQLTALAHGDFAQFNAISEAVKDDAARARKELDAFEQRVLGVKAPATTTFHASDNYGDNTKAKKRAPGLPGAGAGSELKKRLDGELKAIREFAEQQRDAYAFANRYVEAAYSDGIISLQAVFEAQKALRDANLAVTIEALDKEIAAERAAAKKASGADRIEIENKAADAVARRAAAVQKASQDEILAEQQKGAAVKQVQRSYEDLIATIKELNGDTKGAAQSRIEQQVEDAKKVITAAGGDTTLADQLRAGLENTEALKQAQSDYNKLLEQARNAEESIMLAAQASGASELEVLQSLGKARAKSLDDLDALVKRANELALALGTDEAIRFAEQLGLAFKKATLEVDPLLSKIKDLGREAGESIASGLEDALVNGKSLRDVLKGIYSDLVKIATRELVTKPLGDMFSNFLGGTSGGSGGFLGSLLNAGVSYFGGGYSANGGVGYSNAAGISGGRANGGPVLAGGMYEVAEKRPEVLDWNGKKFLLMGNQRGRVEPNPRLQSGGSTLNASIVVQMPPGSTQQTMNQAGAAVARQLAFANHRNN